MLASTVVETAGDREIGLAPTDVALIVQLMCGPVAVWQLWQGLA